MNSKGQATGRLPRIAVIVVNWNTGDLLRQCLNSVVSSTAGGFQIENMIVVDNASADGSADTCGDIPGVSVKRNSTNAGFARACNQGAMLATSSDFLLFVNPDVEVQPDTIPTLVAFMTNAANQKVAICGCRLVRRDGRPAISYSKFPSASDLFWDTTGLKLALPGLFHTRHERPTEAKTIFVDQVIGAVFMVRTHVFQELQGFDERYFVYFEEVDLSRRAANRGYLSACVGEARAMHVEHGSSRRDLESRLVYVVTSRIKYARKHFSPLVALGVLFCSLTIEPAIRTARGIIRASPSEMKMIYRAYSRIVVGLLNHDNCV